MTARFTRFGANDYAINGDRSTAASIGARPMWRAGAVVLGGAMLTGGIGMVAGTLFGGMIFGLIATLINFNGSLNGAWIMISGGVLLFLFIVLQRSIVGSLRLGSST